MVQSVFLRCQEFCKSIVPVVAQLLKYTEKSLNCTLSVGTLCGV